MTKKKKAVKKPQPLPRSVRALLGYLGGSDVKIGGGGGQRAVVAPQSLLGAPQPQQQQQPVITPREKPIGTRIAESPLARLALRPQLPSVTQIVKVKLPSGIPVIETPRVPAVIKPKIEEPKLQVDTSQPKITEYFGKEVKRQQEAEASSAGELTSRGITGSSQLGPATVAKRRGPKPQTEEQKRLKAQLKAQKTPEQKEREKLEKKQRQQQKELERQMRARMEEGFASGSEAEQKQVKQTKPRRITKIIQGVDPSTQISAMTSGGGQAAPPERRGQSLEELSGEK